MIEDKPIISRYKTLDSRIDIMMHIQGMKNDIDMFHLEMGNKLIVLENSLERGICTYTCGED
jgi:hypothetical protein|tara:strand:+ start:330 stop:515 length:186 start_codon:yes stop_codon:yes gene_type:complete